MPRRMTRRQFCQSTAMVLATAIVPVTPAFARRMGGGGGGAGIINPPPGQALRSLPVAPNLSTLPGVTEVALEAGTADVSINGSAARLWTYNGSFPGPVIRARRGDRLRVRFRNALPPDAGFNILGHDRSITNLHTHGLHVSPGGNADNVMLHFNAGEEFVFEYDLSRQAAGTLNFYHPHVHGTVAEQYWSGLVGPLVIEDEMAALADYETHLLVLKDLSISDGAPSAYTMMRDFMHGKEGSTVMVNGQVNPVLPIRRGQVQRWRLLNASNARYYHLTLEGHSLHLAGTDGGPLDRPYARTALLLAPGERADLLVQATRTSGTYRLMAQAYDRGGMTGTQTVTLMTVEYSGRASDRLPPTIDPDAVRPSLDTGSLQRRQITLSMGQGRGYINGQTFIDMENAFQVMSHLGDWEVWEIVNQSGMDHPFHQHVNPALVLSVSGDSTGTNSLYAAAPAWKDTVNVPKWGKVELLVPVLDYAGMTMLHCHIVEHEDIGMMGVWDIMEMM